MLELLPERLRAPYLGSMARYRKSDIHTLPWDEVQVPLRRRDGTEVLVEVAIGEYMVEENTYYTAAIRDITKSKREIEALQISEQRYRQLFEQSLAGVYRVALDGTILEVNEAMARMLGYIREELKKCGAVDLYARSKEREERIRLLLRNGSLTNHVARLRRKDGRGIWVLENSSLIEDSETDGQVIVGTVIDFTERKALEEELEWMAYHDSLTRLANRRLLREMTHKAIAHADRLESRVSILYLDLVRFKRVNDILGHAVGDRVLIEVAERFREHVRATDTIARVGGDEFAVLLVGPIGIEDALTAARNLKQCLDRPFLVSDERFHLEARIGIALYPDHAGDFEELLSYADRAMYRAETSASGIAVYGSTKQNPRREDLVLEEELRQGLERNELVLFYQPIFELPSRTLVAAEALLRWNHSHRGLLVAHEFVPLAEHAGLIHQIDRWVLQTAIRQIGSWGNRAPDWTALNLSPETLSDPELSDFVEKALLEEGVPTERMAIEVTERVAMRNPERVANVLNRLHRTGIRIVIDDFGRGHSSLTYLLHLPTDLLKLNRHLLEGIGSQPTYERLVEGILGLCHGLGIDCVAEGVENRRQLEWFASRECTLAQGFYLGVPVPAEELWETSTPILPTQARNQE